MEEDKKDPGEELMDVDEKGNPIEKAKDSKKTKSNTKYKIALGIILCIIF